MTQFMRTRNYQIVNVIFKNVTKNCLFKKKQKLLSF